MDFVYAKEDNLPWTEFRDVLVSSGLGERRPIGDEKRLRGMVAGAQIIVTCRRKSDGKLVGVARSLSDFAYCSYLGDLAVDRAFQKQGIGKALIEETHKHAGLETDLILLAAPKAKSYYPHIGMEPHESCWIRRRQK